MFSAILAAACLLVFGGCEPEECTQMRECCASVQDRPGVGKACGELTEGIEDPGSCLSVTRSVVAMLQERGESVPEACRISGAKN